jgi:hypothetical protein
LRLRNSFERGIEIDSGGLCQGSPELVAQHAGPHLFDPAFGELAELKRTERNSDEPVHGKAEMFKHALDLAVFAFAQTHCQPAIGALLAVERGFDSGIAHALDRHTLQEPVEHSLVGLAIGAHAVAPQPAGGRKLQHTCEAAVIRQKQEALCVDVETADA